MGKVRTAARVAAMVPTVIGSVAAAAPASGREIHSARVQQQGPPTLVELEDSDLVDGRSVSNRVDELLARYRSYGEIYDESDIDIYEVIDGGSTQYIATTDPSQVQTLSFGADGTIGFQASVTAGAHSEVTSEGVSAQQESWTVIASGCFSRFEYDDAWFDTCYQAVKLQNEADKSYDYYGFHHYGTGYNAYSLSIASSRSECCAFPYDAWVDWDPKSDTTADCASQDVTLAYIVEVTWSHQHCEHWWIYKGAPEDPGVFVARWSDHEVPPVGDRQGNREVAYATAGKVAEGESMRSPYVTSQINWTWS